MGKTLLLTGHPGVGKTTVIKEVVKRLGDSAGGFYTEELTGPGGRKGFELITLSGKRMVLAHKDFRREQLPRVGRYGVDVAAFERVGVAALREAMKTKQVVVVDEIGRMELFSREFQTMVMQAILGPQVVLGTILFKPHPHADLYKQLGQVTLWEMEKRDRETLPARVLAWLKERGVR